MRVTGKLIALSLFIAMTFGTSHGIGLGDIADLLLITPADVASNIIGGGRLVQNSTTFNGATANPPAPFAAGTFTNGLVDGIGIEAGALITSGDVLNAVGPNIDPQLGTDNLQPGDAALDALVGVGRVTNDAAVLEFDFITPKSNVTFEYVFASEEYPPLAIPTDFNDILGIFIAPAGSPLVNVALVPGTTSPISVNTLNGTTTPAIFVNNPVLAPPFLTQYNGFSKVMRNTVNIAPNTFHHVKIAIADGGSAALPDFSVDSAVFVASAMFNVSNIGVFRNGLWPLDVNGDGTFFQPGDIFFNYGQAGDMAVAGDWSGNGTAKLGLFRQGQWILDANGNGSFELPGDIVFFYGQAGDIPVVGDWNGDGITDIGLFRNGQFILDANGSRTFELPGDSVFFYGQTGDIPVAGDWNRSGTDKIGIFRNGLWVLDINDSRGFDAVDRIVSYGTTGDLPVTGNWTGDDDPTKIGIFRNGLWALDTNDNGLFDAQDRIVSFGTAGDRPVSGAW